MTLVFHYEGASGNCLCEEYLEFHLKSYNSIIYIIYLGCDIIHIYAEEAHTIFLRSLETIFLTFIKKQYKEGHRE